MTKRHEILTLLAAAAGLSMATAASASPAPDTVAAPLVAASDLGGGESISTNELGRMIYLADAQGYSRSENANAAGSPDKSPQGNGNAKGFEKSGNPNAAGSPTKPAQGTGNNPS